jgi:Protein of unknown function (DUF4242)
MKTQSARSLTVIAMFLFASLVSVAQTKQVKNNSQTSNVKQMKTYVIEREIPNAGKLTPEQLKGISQKSNGVIQEMGPQIEWLHSYVTGNKIYCVYKAESAEVVREHAKKGGFPANSVSEVATVINPATGH